ncbi:MAG: bifunctional (p)ppGpp synthetase/guanosine-3',5'-bis(diphosphate) 3'-pyrophosphohydrolase [Gammaproteobacteria bacterium]|nr:bifunctional (p)ppGpp synthetase/guanosine-3',5'-bis(diphosphate) 3'-pyrophosphohydrolase [Gammaproteobacteria bacterium]
MRHTLTPAQGQFDTLDGVIEVLTAGFSRTEHDQIAEAAECFWSVRNDPSDYPDSILVANQLKALNVDAETLIAALLGSDVAAECVSVERVAAIYGAAVGELVDHVRRLNSFRVATRNTTNDATETGQGVTALGSRDRAELLRRMLLSMVGDIRAIVVKLAFRTQRLHGLTTLPEQQARRVAAETLEIFAPLANRLGLGQLKWEMEDLCFRVLEPQTYKRVASALEESRADRESYVQKFVAECEHQLNNAGFEDARVFGRPKHIYSIWKKMNYKRVEFKDLFDVRAVRVLVDTVAECYAVLGIVHSSWQPITREFDDYIANPKDNGYRSLHTAVIGPGGKPVEVQIRTRQMDEEAELGVAAHWSYKEGGAADVHLQARINNLRQLLEDNDDDTLVEGFQQQISADRIYVFTPKGDVLDLVAGSTPLDFAYHVHSEIGHRCRGAKINGSIVPLTRQLQNGNQVEILTTREPSPSRDWLNKSLGYLHSSRARAKVRAWFNVQDHEQHLIDGRAILDRELRRAHSTAPIDTLADEFGYAKSADFFVALARNDITASQLATVIGTLEAPAAPQPLPRQREVRSRVNGSDQINVLGVGSLLTQLANCCKPMPPDDIVGFITQGRGVSIHRADCSNMLNLNDEQQQRLIEVGWGEESSGDYRVDIGIVAIDRQGLLRDVSTVLANERVNVVGVNTTSHIEDQIAEMKISAYVDSMDSLTGIMDKLRRLRNVQTVRRVI